MTTHLTPKLKTHPIFTHFQEVWKNTSKIFKIDLFLNSEASIWLNPKLRINKAPFIWKDWLNSGIKTLSDLYEHNVLKSFEDLRQEFRLPQKCFWQYLQLRHLLCSELNLSLTKSTLLKNILSISKSSHAVSKYYSEFIQQNCNLLLVLKNIWEKDLGVSFSEPQWLKICKSFKNLSRDVRIKLIQFKIINHVYWTPARLHRLGLKNTPNCWKCQSMDGTILCGIVLKFWNIGLKFIHL